MMEFKNQNELFKYLWETRPHVSEISGRLLCDPSDQFFHWQFSHTLPKGAFPKYKLNPCNITMMTWKEHQMLTEHPEQTKKLPEWDAYWKAYEHLRKEYFDNR